MVKLKNRFIALFLAIVLSVVCIPTQVLANNMNSTTEKVVIEGVEYTFTTKVKSDKVEVYISSEDGKIKHKILKTDSKIYVDDQQISDTIFNDFEKISNSLKTTNYSEYGIGLNVTSSVRWGSWQYSSQTLSTGGLGTTIVAGMILAFVPSATLKIAAIVAGALARYDKLVIKFKTRYGSDSTYTYYQRYTSYYGKNDGASYLHYIFGPAYDTGKKRL